MKPVAIVQQIGHDTPDYFADFLTAAGIPWQLFRMDLGEPLPASIRAFSGYCMLGGPMSVNDEDTLPWLRQEMSLVQEALAADIPVIGHCLGGQLIAKAMGGTVGPVPMPEIGWSQIHLPESQDAERWLGGEQTVSLFQWHGEGFTVPEGARLIASSPYWANQAFVVGHKHLAMQFHCEVNAPKVRHWTIEERAEIESVQHHPSVSPADDILAGLERTIPQSNQWADRIYREWIKGLVHGA
ncbi:type 1 glutamine amidotransferase [Leeia aquatica]|uniref:Type 1 glutamine amidotransferase n=1 Tax=Leeia aquatica TaxID=2725557 RepID=A0A847SJA8_9NEIS|nr:type 1 glutamine amidotransferase [Leeia aquatica]NLR75992.1 type 1 glutamine amidotransferase [Leeia aquatica]